MSNVFLFGFVFMLKILYINAMGPRRNAPQGGIFVSQRILALKKMGVDIIPINAGITYSPVTRLLLGLKNKLGKKFTI